MKRSSATLAPAQLPSIIVVSMMPSSEVYTQYGGEKHPAFYIPSNLPPKQLAERITHFIEERCNYAYTINPSTIKKADAKHLFLVLNDKWNSRRKTYDTWSINQLEFNFKLTKNNKNSIHHAHIGFDIISGI